MNVKFIFHWNLTVECNAFSKVSVIIFGPDLVAYNGQSYINDFSYVLTGVDDEEFN